MIYNFCLKSVTKLYFEIAPYNFWQFEEFGLHIDLSGLIVLQEHKLWMEWKFPYSWTHYPYMCIFFGGMKYSYFIGDLDASTSKVIEG